MLKSAIISLYKQYGGANDKGFSFLVLLKIIKHSLLQNKFINMCII